MMKKENVRNVISLAAKFCDQCDKPYSQPKKEVFQEQINDRDKKEKESYTVYSGLSGGKIFLIALIVGPMLFVLFNYLLRKFSQSVAYSDFIFLIMIVLSIIFIITVFYFLLKKFRYHSIISPLLVIVIITMASFFIAFFVERQKNVNLKSKYQNGLICINTKEWRQAISIFEEIINKEPYFKNAKSLLDSSTVALNCILADSCISKAKINISKKEYNQALSDLTEAISIVGRNNIINENLYYANLGILKNAENSYWKKNYWKALNVGKLCLDNLKSLPKNDFYNLTSNVSSTNKCDS